MSLLELPSKRPFNGLKMAQLCLCLLQARQRGLLFAGESGIFTPEHVTHAQQAGCQAILVGESLVKESDQEAAVRQLLA